MSDVAHIFHPERDERGLPLLFDDCPGCKRHVETGGLTLDGSRFAIAWLQMVEVEYHARGAYLSQLDKELGRQLHTMALHLERRTTIDPWTWPLRNRL